MLSFFFKLSKAIPLQPDVMKRYNQIYLKNSIDYLPKMQPNAHALQSAKNAHTYIHFDAFRLFILLLKFTQIS